MATNESILKEYSSVEKTSSKFDLALEELTKGLYDQAEYLCAEGLKEDPKNGYGWHVMGLIFKDRSNADAVRAFRTAVHSGYNSLDRIGEVAQAEFPLLLDKVDICSQILQTWIEQETGYTIQSGIFRGVKVHPQASNIPLLLGYKDIEIHGWLSDLNGYRKIIVDDPYYAVGLKRIYPSTEIATAEGALVAALANMNNVTISYNLHGTDLLIATSPLDNLIDCDVIAPSLERVGDALCVEQQARKPDHPTIRNYPDYIRFLSLLENKPYYYWYWRKSR